MPRSRWGGRPYPSTRRSVSCRSFAEKSSGSRAPGGDEDPQRRRDAVVNTPDPDRDVDQGSYRAHPDWIIELPPEGARVRLDNLMSEAPKVEFALPALRLIADYVIYDRQGSRALRPHALVLRRALPDEAYQEASFGMVFRAALAGAPVQLSGMNPERPVSAFTVPAPPSIEIEIDGQREACAPMLTHLVIRPTDNKVNAVWCAKTHGLPRVPIPQIHENIPLAVSANGGAPLRYVSPPTIRARLAEARGARPLAR